MRSTHEAWWKMVVAELDGTVAETEAGLRVAAEACGFHSRGVRNEALSFVRSELLLLIPTRYEWRIDVLACPHDRSEFGVRVGIAPGLGYYGSLALIFAAAITAGLQVLSHPEFEAALLLLMGVLMILPIVQSIVLRLRAASFERRLWREMAGLGPWRNARVIKRSLNQAYGEDQVVPCRDLSAEAVAREAATKR